MKPSSSRGNHGGCTSMLEQICSDLEPRTRFYSSRDHRACVSTETRHPRKLDHFYHVSSRLPGLEGKPGWIVARVGLGSPGARNLLESLKKSRQFRQFVSLTSLRFHL